MAPLRYLAAGLALLGAAVGASAQTTAVTVAASDICIGSINKARSAKLDVRVPALTKKTGAATDAINAVKAALNNAADNTNCNLKASAIPTLTGVIGFLHKFEKASSALTAADCDAAVEAIITGAITEIGSNADKPFKKNTAPYLDTAKNAQNFGYMMDENATEILCAITGGCKDSKSVLVCKFYPTIDVTAGTGVPVLKDGFFDAVKARETAKVKISTLADSDLDSPLTDKGAPKGDSKKAKDGKSSAVVPATAGVLFALLGLLNL